jgi:ATP-dependent DNA helicase RecG
VRNLTYRHLPSATLFPAEVKQYDEWVVRETLHNCIAHQDYRLGGRINVVEEPDSLLFTNLGGFIPGSVENMIHRDAPPEVYRNPFLAQAMVNLNMIDTIGSGIRKMFTIQRSRFFPLPDFDLAEPGRVKVRHLGKVLDEKYTRMLMDHTDLDLDTIIALDKVQKKRPVDDETFARLKKWKLIEGRRPNVFISAHLAAVTGAKAVYIKHRGLDKTHYKALVVSFLEKFEQSARGDIEGFLREKISDALSVDQKTNRIRNLLQEMRREGTLICEGHGPAAIWRLAKPGSNLKI